VVDFDAKTVVCKKCHHQASSDEYDKDELSNFPVYAISKKWPSPLVQRSQLICI
jgi:hypothetical protein